MSDDNLTLADLQDRVRDRAAAYLTIVSETDSPADLAEAAELSPDDQWSKGDPRGRLGNLAPTNGVTFESQLGEDESPTKHVEALTERLRPHADKLHALLAREGTSGTVHVVEHAGFATEWFANVEAHVRPIDLATLAAMGVAISFDAYVYGEDATD